MRLSLGDVAYQEITRSCGSFLTMVGDDGGFVGISRWQLMRL